MITPKSENLFFPSDFIESRVIFILQSLFFIVED